MKIIKINDWSEVPVNFTGIAENILGDKEWYLNGKLHREDGPAFERANGHKEWCLNGKLHRVDGPAVEFADGYKLYWINDVEVTKEAQEVLYAMYKLKGII